MTDSGGSIEGGASLRRLDGGRGDGEAQAPVIPTSIGQPSDLDSHSESCLIAVSNIVSIGDPCGQLVVTQGDGRVEWFFPVTATFASTGWVDFRITHPRYKRKNWRNMPRNPKPKRIRKKWGLL